MASTRTILFSLNKIAGSRSSSVLFNVSQARTLSTTTSSWVPTSKRKTLLQYGRHTAPPQRLSVSRGKSLSNLTTQNIGGGSPFRSEKQSFRNGDTNGKKRKYESDLVVVLDMDECLIHSQFLKGPGAKYAHQVQRGTPASNGGNGVDTFRVTLPDGEQVLVHERPHLHEFLREVSSKYETHIFTAAMEVYAKPVLKMLDPHGDIFSGIWYRESCQLDSSMGAYIKNLGTICESFDNDVNIQQRLNRTVLVDNNPLSFLANPEHGILVSSFYDDSRDTTLPAVLDLLHELDKHEDVRPVLNEKFRLKQALDDISSGRPFSGRHQQIDEQQQQQQQQQQQEHASSSVAVAN